jgi:hypothetical protein
MLRWGSCKMIDVISKPIFKVATLLIIGVSLVGIASYYSASLLTVHISQLLLLASSGQFGIIRLLLLVISFTTMCFWV